MQSTGTRSEDQPNHYSLHYEKFAVDIYQERMWWYDGVLISSDLMRNKQVKEQSAKANKELNYFRRNTRTIHSGIILHRHISIILSIQEDLFISSSYLLPQEH